MMLESFLWILGMGFFGGQIARRLGAPAHVGMVLIGIVLGPSVAHVLSPDLLAGAAPLRTVAVMVILMKAGLGLDRDKLAQQGTVALRLGFLPALGETLVVAIAAGVCLGAAQYGSGGGDRRGGADSPQCPDPQHCPSTL